MPNLQHVTTKTIDGDVKWNFDTFLIATDGTLLARFDPGTEPEAAPRLAAIEEALT